MTVDLRGTVTPAYKGERTCVVVSRLGNSGQRTGIWKPILYSPCTGGSWGVSTLSDFRALWGVVVNWNLILTASWMGGFR